MLKTLIIIGFVINFFGDFHCNLLYVLNKIVTITFDVCIFHASLGFRLIPIFFLFYTIKRKLFFRKTIVKFIASPPSLCWLMHIL